MEQLKLLMFPESWDHCLHAGCRIKSKPVIKTCQIESGFSHFSIGEGYSCVTLDWKFNSQGWTIWSFANLLLVKVRSGLNFYTSGDRIPRRGRPELLCVNHITVKSSTPIFQEKPPKVIRFCLFEIHQPYLPWHWAVLH